MANIKSQIKRNITNEKKHLINKSYKSKINTFYNKAIIAINENSDQAASLDLVKKFCSSVDKAVNKKIVHANKAANKKAKIMNEYNKNLNNEIKK